jgi:phenylacetate-CoA ligase
MTLDDHLHHLVGKYTAAPQWVKTIAGGAYAMLPPSFRFGRQFNHFKQRFLSDTGVAEYAAGRLQATLFEALAHVPAFAQYRELLGDIERDPYRVLSQLPLTSKEDIKAALPSYLSTAWPASARLRMFTGGSTSVPMTFYIHKGISRAKEWAAFHAMAARFGTDGDGVVLAMRGRTVTSAGHGRIWSYEPVKRHLIVSSDHLEPQHMPAYVDALKRLPPSYIHAFPSALYPLVAWLRDNGHEGLLASVKCVALSSESVFDHHMAAFRAFFGCPVIAIYGHTERVLFANMLPADPRYHFWPQYGHVELVDATGHPVTRPGQIGEIVGTSFDNQVMPFLRYRTGDYAVWSEQPSPALPAWPVVDRIEGRLQEFVVCHDHRLVTVTTLGAAHFEQLDQCLRIQYEQREPGKLILRVMPLRKLADTDCAAIARAVEEKTQGGCTVRVEQVDAIPVTERGKQRLLMQHLDISDYLGASIEGRMAARAG